jgi:hypothetical protein
LISDFYLKESIKLTDIEPFTQFTDLNPNIKLHEVMRAMSIIPNHKELSKEG